MAMLLFLFFFSSRRRHTRSLCDWSSDVCSSDLNFRDSSQQHRVALRLPPGVTAEPAVLEGSVPPRSRLSFPVKIKVTDRSEERRVGKECRYGWARYDEQKKQQERGLGPNTGKRT